MGARTASPLPHAQHSTAGSDPHLMFHTSINLEKLKEPQRAQKPHRAEFTTRFPTSAHIQAAFPELQGSIWTKFMGFFFAWGQAASGEQCQESNARRAASLCHKPPQIWGTAPWEGFRGAAKRGKAKACGHLDQKQRLKNKQGLSFEF